MHISIVRTVTYTAKAQLVEKQSRTREALMENKRKTPDLYDDCYFFYIG